MVDSYVSYKNTVLRGFCLPEGEVMILLEDLVLSCCVLCRISLFLQSYQILYFDIYSCLKVAKSLAKHLGFISSQNVNAMASHNVALPI